ncbi:histidine phosphatase family protein [soil metagenome]
MVDETLDLWLVRHGETDWNAEHRVHGQKNSQLSQLGRKQAEVLARRLQNETFDRIYSSDSARAQDTAGAVFPKAKLCLDERLRELSYGVLEGKTYAEFTPAEGAMRQAMYADPLNRRADGGETWLELIARVSDWLTSLPKSGRVIAFSHGGTIRAAVFSFIDPPKAYEWNLTFGNTGITRLRLNEASKVIVTLNDTAHLEGFDG